MAFAAVTSLAHTIDLLLSSCHVSVASSTLEILESAKSSAESLQQSLYQNDMIKNGSDGVLGVDARIRDEARKLEDAIESEASAQFVSQSQMRGTHSLNLDHLRHVIGRFLDMSKKMVEEYEEESNKLPPTPSEEAAAAGTVSSTSDDHNMVGSSASDLILKIRNKLAAFRNVDLSSENRYRVVNVVDITGMAGTGKTTLARKVFHDPLVVKNFQCRAFVRLGMPRDPIGVLRAIIAQLNVDSQDEMILESDEDVYNCFRRCLGFRKYLIVLDDAWGAASFRVFLGELLTENGFLLVTSRIDDALPYEYSHSYYHPYKMELLKDDESWELLQRKVFGEEDCPPPLVKPGKKIAEKCEGLPLLIVTVAELLSKAEEKTPEYWKEVAEMRNSLFEEALDQIYELLLPSYHYLDQNSKACFLYMNAFPKGYAVPRSRINNLWRSELFAEAIERILVDLVSNNVVVIHQNRPSFLLHEAKACSLHVSYRHVSKRLGEDNKFLHIINSYDVDGPTQRIEESRYLAIYHNSLLAMKEVHDSIDSPVSTLRSVLCTGSYHQYQVPICLELKLLRVLDAVSIRFYEFPGEVVKLIQLRYLSLTTNANIPPSINKLRFLLSLIIHQHWSIINRSGVAESSYVPEEIWELQELEHLEIMGRNLPHPPQGAILRKLRELVGVGVLSCDKAIIQSLPNLDKLKVQIESGPNSAQTMSFFENIFSINSLPTLRCQVVNPKLFPKPKVPPQLPSIGMTFVRKLTLSGFGYPWKDMSKFAGLRSLKVLKLQSYAFRGEKWRATEMRFDNLRYLSIEDTDLVEWTAEYETFERLLVLSMKHCYKLHKIPQFNHVPKIELDDCNPLAESCAAHHYDMEEVHSTIHGKSNEKIIS